MTSPRHRATGARKSDDPTGISTPSKSKWFSSLFLRLRRWYRTSVLRLLVTESCSLFHRIQGTLEIRAWELRGHKGRPRILSGWTPLAGPQHYRRACIEYMQQLQARHPFLSILDLFLLEQAWRAGAEWDGRICTSQNQEVWGPSLTSQDGDSMPPQAVRQSTKRDPSGRLP